VYALVLVRPGKKIKPSSALLRDYAHRGLHGNGVPENSMQAFELACQGGFGIELDVQLSRDGVVMVFHDDTLNRVTGVDKKLCELTAQELTKISLSGTDQTIPTFVDVLKLVDGRVPLLVELKGESFDVSLCKKVADILLEYKGEFCVESFNPLLIKEIKKYLPDAFRGQLYTNVCRDKKSHSALNIIISLMALNFLATPDFIAYNKLDRNSLPVKLSAKLYRAPSFVWTTRGKAELDKAHALGEIPIFEDRDK
jgi:glycerophosphoryl diester phosphodiesterase